MTSYNVYDNPVSYNTYNPKYIYNERTGIYEKKKWSAGKIVMLIALFVIVVAIALFIILNNTTGVIKPYDYVSDPPVSGYNGYGIMTVNDGDNNASEEKFVQYMTEYRAGDLNFKKEYQETGNQWLADHNYENLMDLVLSYFLTDYSVSKTISTRTIYVRNFGSYALEADKYTNLSNGDIVTLSWTFNGKENEFRKLEEYINLDIDTSDVVIEISGLEESPSAISPAQINDELIESLCEYAFSDFNDYIADEWDSVKQLQSLEYNGYILASDPLTSDNMIILSFEGNVLCTTENVSQSAGFWIYYKFDHLREMSNGRIYADTANAICPYFLKEYNQNQIHRWFRRLNQHFSVEIDGKMFGLPGYQTEEDMWEDQLSEYTDTCSFWYVDKTGNERYLDFREYSDVAEYVNALYS